MSQSKGFLKTERRSTSNPLVFLEIGLDGKSSKFQNMVQESQENHIHWQALGEYAHSLMDNITLEGDCLQLFVISSIVCGLPIGWVCLQLAAWLLNSSRMSLPRCSTFLMQSKCYGENCCSLTNFGQILLISNISKNNPQNLVGCNNKEVWSFSLECLLVRCYNARCWTDSRRVHWFQTDILGSDCDLTVICLVCHADSWEFSAAMHWRSWDWTIYRSSIDVQRVPFSSHHKEVHGSRRRFL